MPSVGCIEMARTRLSPRCWATSRVSVRVLLAQGDVDVQGVVDLGHRLGGELDVHDRADDAGRPGRRRALADSVEVSSRVAVIASQLLLVIVPASLAAVTTAVASARALAPPTISLISWVISDWRALFASRV